MPKYDIACLFQRAAQHHQAGALSQAEAIYREILAADPQHADALHYLGVLALAVGHQQVAVDLMEASLAVHPNNSACLSDLGLAYRDLNRIEDTIASFRQALALMPGNFLAHANLGITLFGRGEVDEAISCFQAALAINNDSAIQTYLGSAFKTRGQLDRAIACYREGLAKDRGNVIAHSSLIYTMHLDPAYDAQGLWEEHRRWNQLHAAPYKKQHVAHDAAPSPHRRLRVGYVSSDFRLHPVARFILPLLEGHHHSDIEVFCYSNVSTPDALTGRIRSCADQWREIVSLNDAQVDQLVRQDGIDILVDLNMHTMGNRLLVFARKPAPLQVTYLAYCSTTGLEAMDYRFTDPYMDPPDSNDLYYSERSIRLEGTYWCYQANPSAPEVNPLPALAAGHVTFGCLNNFCKVNEAALEVWSEIMASVPQSRLILHAYEGAHRQQARAFFTDKGIAGERIQFVGLVPPVRYFQTYWEIDIGLDPFPCGGGTTTCDALWMGVPVISLIGQMPISRCGLSILSNVGLPNLAVQTEAEYVEKAVAISKDLLQLSQLRKTLRPQMESSRLMDARTFVQSIETAYRTMWQKWCDAQSPAARF